MDGPMAPDRRAAPPAHDPRHARLARLASSLRDRRFTVELYGLHLIASSLPRSGSVEVWCATRPADGGRLWFFHAGGDPICPADHVRDAELAVEHILRGVRL